MFEADRFFALFLVRENVGNFEMLSSAQGSWFSHLAGFSQKSLPK